MSAYLIVAPHVDDELIGCYSVLTEAGRPRTVVLYLQELTAERRKEAHVAASYFHFLPVFDPRDPVLDKETFTEVWVPSRKDNHPHHKIANAAFRKQATAFYSVDMGKGSRVLPVYEAARKKHLLDTLYPSQKRLWEQDDRYWLFENIQERDYDVFQTYDIGDFLVTVPEGTRIDRGEFVELSPEEVFNKLLQLCPQDKVTLTTIDGRRFES